MKDILVSVCIPVYNAEKYLEIMIKSIMKQSHKNIEIIVSDNASKDNSSVIVKKLMEEDSRIKLNINNENIGFSGNVNKLIDLAKSEYIAIYHADDIYDSRIIEEQIKYLLENNEIAGCFTLGKQIDENGQNIRSKFYMNEKNTKCDIIVDLEKYISNIFRYGGSTFICPTSMIRKSVYEMIGVYNMKLKYVEDQDMYIRILEKYNMGIVCKELIYYRVHPAQGSSYYSSRNRDELSSHLVQIHSYLEENITLKNKFCNQLNKAISNDYLMLVKNNIANGNINNVKKYIELSKKYYVYHNFKRGFLLQKSDSKIIHVIAKILITIKIIIMK